MVTSGGRLPPQALGLSSTVLGLSSGRVIGDFSGQLPSPTGRMPTPAQAVQGVWVGWARNARPRACLFRYYNDMPAVLGRLLDPSVGGSDPDAAPVIGQLAESGASHAPIYHGRTRARTHTCAHAAAQAHSHACVRVNACLCKCTPYSYACTHVCAHACAHVHPHFHNSCEHMAIAYQVMAYVFIAYVAMAYTVMAYIGMVNPSTPRNPRAHTCMRMSARMSIHMCIGASFPSLALHAEWQRYLWWPIHFWPIQLWPIQLWPIQLWPIQLRPIQLWPIQLWPIQLCPK